MGGGHAGGNGVVTGGASPVAPNGMPSDSFEYSIIAAILRCVSEAAAADTARLAKEVKGIHLSKLSAEALFDRVSVLELGVTELIVMAETLVKAAELV